MKKIILAVAVALTLAGCAGTPAGEILRAASSTYANPVDGTNIYQVKNAYAAALTLVVRYREYCWSKPYAALMADPVSKPICERRREVVRVAQKTRRQARGAIDAADRFIAQN